MKAGSEQISNQTFGILLGVDPNSSTFRYGIGLAETAQQEGIQVFLYLLDDSVRAADSRELHKLVQCGVKISGCAYAAQRRNLSLSDHIVWGGLKMLNDIILHSNRFIGFCC